MGNNYRTTDLAYIAGMLDGDGYISIRTNSIKATGRDSYSNKVSITNTCYDVMLHIQSILGGRIYTPPKPFKPGYKTVYKLEWSGTEAANVAELLLPYLVIKKELAKLTVAFRKIVDMKVGRTKVLTEAEHIIRQSFVEATANYHIRGGPK